MAMMVPMAVGFCHFDLVDAGIDVVWLVFESFEWSPWHYYCNSLNACVCRNDVMQEFFFFFESQVQVKVGASGCFCALQRTMSKGGEKSVCIYEEGEIKGREAQV
jgi:hypothetical protein